MTKALARGLALAATTTILIVGWGASPGFAHSDWGLPLVGGLVGGYGLSSLMHRQDQPRAPEVAHQYVPPPPVYAAPAPVPPASATAASVEHQLNVLDDLAAKGYITPDEYKTRRQALLNQL